MIIRCRIIKVAGNGFGLGEGGGKRSSNVQLTTNVDRSTNAQI